MKYKIIAVLTLSVLMSAVQTNSYAYLAYELDECGSRKSDENCGYFKSSYAKPFDSINTAYNDKESCCAKNSLGVCNNESCYITSYNICVYNGSGYDAYAECADVCGDLGYDAFVSKYDSGTYSYGCACRYPNGFVEWRDYTTGVMRRYTRQRSNPMTGCTDVALDEYKCASGYYGTAPGGCKACPANATCGGSTYFSCKDGYYENDTKTGCIKCPNSKEGGLGWDSAGNAIDAINGDTYKEWCAIGEGTTLHDTSGTFVIEGGDCEWSE